MEQRYCFCVPFMRTLWMCCFLIFFVMFSLTAQLFPHQEISNPRTPRFKISLYKTKEGLSANATKALVQDTNNILWIGLDEGLSRFDGTQFRNFRNNLPSRYVKYLYRTRNNRILVGHDAGISEIRESPDTIAFTTILRGERTETSSAINYPKQLFEEEDGTLWIAESKSIVRFKNGAISRYHFDVRCQTNSFLRSFSFVPDGFGSFIVCSQTGYCFWYNRTTNSFTEIPLPSNNIPLESASDMLNVGQGVVWIGYSGGIAELHLDAQGHLLSFVQRLRQPGVSLIHRAADSTIFVGTWFSGLFTIDRVSTSGKINARRCPTPFNTINMMVSNRNGDIWLSSDDGIALLKPSSVLTCEFGKAARGYIQAITKDSLSTLYTSDGMAAYQISTTEHSLDDMPIPKQIFRTRGTDILSMAHTQNYLWCGTTDGKLYRIAAKNLPKATPIANSGHKESQQIHVQNRHFDSIGTIIQQSRNPTLFYLFADSRSKLWACGELDAGALCITEGTSLQAPAVKLYDDSRGLPSVIRCFKESPEKVLYCGGRSHARVQYFFRYSLANDRFEDLSKSLPPEAGADFEVNDLYVRNDNDAWLCSSTGLFHHTATGIMKVPIFYAPTGEEIINIKAIESDGNGALWIGTSHGIVVYYDNGEYFFLNENGGLPANEIAFRALLWGGKNLGMWAGTVKGLANIPTISTIPPSTPTPLPIFLRVNGLKVPLENIFRQNSSTLNSQEIIFPSASDVQIGFLSVVFGEDAVSYQYRLLSSKRDSAWSPPQQGSLVTLLTLPADTYCLEVRAIQSGAYRWSRPMVFRFQVTEAWHERWWGRLGMLVLASGIIWGAVHINSRRLKKQKRELQELIQERTHEIYTQSQELHDRNNELLKLNAEKNEFLGIVAHDLKNPISGIRSLAELLLEGDSSLDKETEHHILTTIVSSAERMLRLVSDLLNVNQIEQGANNPVLIALDISPALAFVLESYRERAAAKDIHLQLEINGSTTVYANEQAVEQVLDNLISNAVKYSPFGKQIRINVLENTETVRIEIHDEGPGFSEADISKLFRKFVRLSAKPTGGEHSSGLGLSIVKKLVDAMHGRIWCESILGKGATFIVELPTKQQI